MLDALSFGGSTTEPPQVHTVAELQRALPTKNQVPAASKKTSTCPSEEFRENGTGTIADATVDGWRGFSVSRVQKFSGSPRRR